MPKLERRLQLLLDEARYQKVAAEAARSGSSVAAVIRSAIDAHLGGPVARRAAAAAFLLHSADQSGAPGDDWADVKRDLESELAAKLPSHA